MHRVSVKRPIPVASADIRAMLAVRRDDRIMHSGDNPQDFSLFRRLIWNARRRYRAETNSPARSRHPAIDRKDRAMLHRLSYSNLKFSEPRTEYESSTRWRSPLSFLWAALFLFVVVASNDAAAAPGSTGPRPVNVVFFLVDDLGQRDLGCYGSTFYETKYVDQLAAAGARFTCAYAACPVCSPTRASILAGKYPTRTHITDYISPNRSNQPENWPRNTRLRPAEYSDRLALEEVTLAEAFKSAGYATMHVGKWHLGPEGFYPENQGFDVNMGGFEQGAPFGGKKYFSPYNNPRLPDGPPGEHLPNRLANEAVKFIREHREQPFFIYFPFYSVHTPLMAREDLQRKYGEKHKRLGIEPKWGREAERQVRLVQEHAVYAAMIEAMDLAVGKVLAALDEAGLSDNTVVFFTSDNGGLSTSEGSPTSNLPLRAGKGWLYEGGIREPLVVRWPGVVKPGSVIDEPIISTDYYPTILEMAGLPARPEQHVDGVSLAPLLKTGEAPAPRSLFWHYPHYSPQGGAPSAAIRKGDWKLIEWFEDQNVELFDVAHDLAEQHDLAAEHPETVKELRAELHAWQKATGATFPTRR
jgi:arylsulfatase A-like enzyme